MPCCGARRAQRGVRGMLQGARRRATALRAPHACQAGPEGRLRPLRALLRTGPAAMKAGAQQRATRARLVLERVHHAAVERARVHRRQPHSAGRGGRHGGRVGGQRLRVRAARRPAHAARAAARHRRRVRRQRRRVAVRRRRRAGRARQRACRSGFRRSQRNCKPSKPLTPATACQPETRLGPGQA